MPIYDSAPPQRKRLKRYILLAAIVALVVVIVYLLGSLSGNRGTISGTRLRCIVSQDVTPFDDRILYYDANTLFCLSTSGTELWKASVGENARFSAGEKQVVVWSGNQLMLFDRNGRPTYSDRLSEPIQFARVGTKYMAVVTGDGVTPTLTVRDMEGTQIDTEVTNYTDLMMLDCGFFGDGEYLWTTALDVYGSAPETTMHVYRVGAMNTGNISLGEPITYAVVYSGNYLNVINTRQLRLYDYRGTESASDAVLVYGWKLIGHPHQQFPLSAAGSCAADGHRRRVHRAPFAARQIRHPLFPARFLRGRGHPRPPPVRLLQQQPVPGGHRRAALFRPAPARGRRGDRLSGHHQQRHSLAGVRLGSMGGLPALRKP